MLFVAVNEPHDEEAIAHTVVDPETGHEETQLARASSRTRLTSGESHAKMLSIPQRVAVKYQKNIL